MDINELKQKRAELIDKCRSLVTAAETEKRDFTDPEQVQYDGWMKEVKSLKVKIERAEELEIEERQIGNQNQGATSPDLGTGKVTGGEDRAAKKPWESFGHFLRAVAAVPMEGRVDARLAAETRAASGMSEGSMADGGFLVAPEYSDTLINDAIETGIVSSKCMRIPMARNSLSMNGVDETSRANGSRWGGIQAYWEGEADEATGSKPKFRQINLKSKKLTGLCYATDELLEDARALATVISSGFKSEFGFKIDDAIINGSGAGMPLGIINAGCKVSQAKETGQTAATFIAENAMKMFSRLMPQDVMNSVWYINQELWPQIFQLHLTVGTGGVPLYIEPGKLPYAPMGAILGRPIQPLEQCQALGTAGDIILGNMGQYILGTKGDTQTASSMHVKFTTGEMAYRFTLRIDGQPVRATALTPYKGSATQSSFVVLANRA